jgi:cholesterol transport system auxiliary component
MPIAHRPSRQASLQRTTYLLTLTVVAWALTACAVPTPPTAKTIYDFGPVSRTAPAGNTMATSPPLALAEIEASPALDSTAVQYRFAYANAQELRPYTLARWSMPPALLVQQRVRSALEAHGPVLTPGEASPAFTLKLELEEFSQLFEAPDRSRGVLKLRATLLKGAALAAQRSFSASADAPTADVAGGALALSRATDQAATQLAEWVAQNMR